MKVYDWRKSITGESQILDGKILKLEFWGNSYHDLRVFLDTGYVVDFEFAGTDDLMKVVTEKLEKEVMTRMTKGVKKNG